MPTAEDTDISPTTQSKFVLQDGSNSAMFEKAYSTVLDGTQDWQDLEVPTGKLYEFDEKY